jgi:hypothetical protein
LRSCSRSHSPLCCGRPEPLACCGATSAGPEKVGSRSHPLRHLLSRKRSPDPAAAGSPVATTGNSVQSGKHQARSLNPPVPLIAIDSALDRGGSRRSRGWPQGSVQPRLTCRGADGKGRCSARFLQCNRSDRWPASIAGHPARAPMETGMLSKPERQVVDDRLTASAAMIVTSYGALSGELAHEPSISSV